MDTFVLTCLKEPEALFIIEAYTDRSVTYGDLLQMVNGLANVLYERRIRQGDRVVLMFDNQLEFIVAHFALLRLGAIAVPLAANVNEEMLQHVLNQAQPSCLLGKEGLKLPGELHVDHTSPDAPMFVLTITEQQLRQDMSHDTTFSPSLLHDDDPIAILYTSGTTGRSKGVIMKYGAVLADFDDFGQDLSFDCSTRIIQMMPIHHADGWCYSFLLPFRFGSSVLLTPTFQASVGASFDRLVGQYGGNVLIAVPSMLKSLLAFKPRYREPVEGKLHYVLCGSAKLHHELVASFEAQFDTRILENYGSTEALLIAYYTPETPYRKGSVGTRAPRCEIRITEDGEIAVRSPYLFGGYYELPEVTAEVLKDGWYYTGDEGLVDEDGFLHLAGRKTQDVINKAGNKIPASAIDEVLLAYSGVVDAATLGLPDAVYGEDVYSFVAASEVGKVAEAELMEYARATLPREQWPKRIVIVEAIPRTAIGKVIRPDLIELLKQPTGGV